MSERELRARLKMCAGAVEESLGKWLSARRHGYESLKNFNFELVHERPNRTINICADGPKILIMPNITDVAYCYTHDQWIERLWAGLRFSAFHYPMMALNLLIFLFGTTGNIFVCLSVKRNHQLRSVTNYFIVNLAFADFLVILICLPATVVWDLSLTWFFDTIPCKLIMFLQDVSISVSVLTLTAISIERYHAICHPLKFKSSLSQAKRVIALIWLVSLLIMVPDLIYLRAMPSEDLSEAGLDTVLYSDCNYDWSTEASRAFQFVKTILLYLVPFVLMLCAHYRILQVLRLASSMMNEGASSTSYYRPSGCAGSAAASEQRAARLEPGKEQLGGERPSVSEFAPDSIRGSPGAQAERARLQVKRSHSDTVQPVAIGRPLATDAAALKEGARQRLHHCKHHKRHHRHHHRCRHHCHSCRDHLDLEGRRARERRSTCERCDSALARSRRQHKHNVAATHLNARVAAVQVGELSKSQSSISDTANKTAASWSLCELCQPGAFHSRNRKARTPAASEQSGPSASTKTTAVLAPTRQPVAESESRSLPASGRNSPPSPAGPIDRASRGASQAAKQFQRRPEARGQLARPQARKSAVHFGLGTNTCGAEHNQGEQQNEAQRARDYLKRQRMLRELLCERDSSEQWAGAEQSRAHEPRLLGGLVGELAGHQDVRSASKLELIAAHLRLAPRLARLGRRRPARPAELAGSQPAKMNGCARSKLSWVELSPRGVGGGGAVHKLKLRARCALATGASANPVHAPTSSKIPIPMTTFDADNTANQFILTMHNKSKLESRRKAAKMLTAIVVLFGICYLPVHLINFLRQFIEDIPQTDVTSTISMLAHCVCYLNSAINPIIYNHMNCAFRAEFRKFLSCLDWRRLMAAPASAPRTSQLEAGQATSGLEQAHANEVMMANGQALSSERQQQQHHQQQPRGQNMKWQHKH